LLDSGKKEISKNPWKAQKSVLQSKASLIAAGLRKTKEFRIEIQ
jgi:hypothetical protein